METWEKVTTRSQVSVYRTNDPMVTIAAIDLKHDQDGRYTQTLSSILSLFLEYETGHVKLYPNSTKPNKIKRWVIAI